MQTNDYYDKLTRFRDLLKELLAEFHSDCEHNLFLQLSNYNLLQREGNCIESSTALGFILEEFIVSKLIEHSKKGGREDYSIHSYTNGTSTRSSDCYALYENLEILINVKTERIGLNANDAVAAINRLVKDYCLNAKSELAYLVLKVRYDFVDTGLSRSIIIDDAPIMLYLEEFDYSREHIQDHREWSKNQKTNSGRLQLPDRFTQEHKMPIHCISHELTKRQLIQLNTKKAAKNEKHRMPKEARPTRKKD